VSEANVELVRSMNTSLGAGEVEGLIGRFHEDAEWRDLQHAPDMPEVVQGRAAILALWAQWTEVFDEFKAEVFEYVDADPWVICDSHWYGTGKGSELVVDLRCADAYEVREGKLARAVVGYADVATALKAVRLEY
jgi:ketosteroid isomerase-like protein